MNKKRLDEIIDESIKQVITEKRSLLAEMARIGFIGKKGELEVYIRTNDPGNIPHFHVRDTSTMGTEFETCVRIQTNAFFLYGRYKDTLNSAERKALAEFMEAPDVDGHFSSNYSATIYEWNKNNSNVKIQIQHDENGNEIIPNYRTISV